MIETICDRCDKQDVCPNKWKVSIFDEALQKLMYTANVEDGSILLHPDMTQYITDVTGPNATFERLGIDVNLGCWNYSKAISKE